MTIHVELNPEMERQLAAEAIDSRHCAGSVCATAPPGSNCSRSKGHMRVNQEEFRAFLDALASKASNVPQLRTEIFSREMIDGEHA